ncbi:ArsR/SmtB family transcription factor [Ewingella americana]|jgi:DNA-binding transcriptional ArsR family regulator|uniref:Transcriptional regulator n=1 Tax=Ewingella americana TaxID=41202 RepID=A0A502GQY6_9GAMM|nr:metalloregulator ArsR/SmtB family transcription factor [Ewingella americana]TPG64294.1 transcriptional regulator [Ewingella americana]
MANTEPGLLQESASQASKLLKSMSNANRLLILCMLVDSPGTSAGDLCKLTGLSPSATSQHLARMKEEGLIECAREGQKMNYFIKNASVKTIISTLRDIYCPEDLT